MSVLDTPRLYFTGKWSWDPIVTNNSPSYWDIETSKPAPQPTNAAKYRERVIDRIDAPKATNWNPQGTHRSVLYETDVTGLDTGGGWTDDDALCGVPVEFRSMLVDGNPYLGNTSQLFFDQFTVGIDGGPQIVMPQNGPMVARYVNFGRNPSLEIAGVASVIWQASCVDGLQIAPFGSRILEMFQDAIDSGAAGLTVRINAYRTFYFNGPPPDPSGDPLARYREFKTRVETGGFQPNPARSLLVGVIGLHHAGEPGATPADRRLSGSLGTAFARVDQDGKRLVLDLANSVPETNPEAHKKDLGALNVTAGGQLVGSLPYADYDKSAYEKTSGMVTLDVPPALAGSITTEDLAVSNESGPLLAEDALSAVAHPPNLYLEMDEVVTVDVQVLSHGEPVAEAIDVQVAEVQRNLGGSHNPPTPDPPLQVATLRTDGSGRLTLRFSREANVECQVFDGSSQWAITPYVGTEPTPPTTAEWNQNLLWNSHCYVVTRTTPIDKDIADLAPTWTNVHRKVLIDWEALAPCMDNWLKLGDEAQCRSMAATIKNLTSRDNFNSFWYMPVTRGLSSGQRTLLHKWCDAVIAGTAGDLTTPTEPAAVPSDAEQVSAAMPADEVDLSRGASRHAPPPS